MPLVRLGDAGAYKLKAIQEARYIVLAVMVERRRIVLSREFLAESPFQLADRKDEIAAVRDTVDDQPRYLARRLRLVEVQGHCRNNTNRLEEVDEFTDPPVVKNLIRVLKVACDGRYQVAGPRQTEYSRLILCSAWLVAARISARSAREPLLKETS
jgi:hypothetical protein